MRGQPSYGGRRSPAISTAFALLIVAGPFALPADLMAQEGAVEPEADVEPSPARAYDRSPLEPGDAIRVTAWREEDMRGEYTVDEGGVVVLPMLGARRVAQVPLAELERRLKDEYAGQLRNQDVEITFLRRVSVLGSVREPGLYLLDSTMRLSDALALAGGAEPDGRPDDAQILRAGVEVTDLIDRTRPLAGQLKSGDEIRVPRSSWFSRNGVMFGASLVSAAAILIAATLN